MTISFSFENLSVYAAKLGKFLFDTRPNNWCLPFVLCIYTSIFLVKKFIAILSRPSWSIDAKYVPRWLEGIRVLKRTLILFLIFEQLVLCREYFKSLANPSPSLECVFKILPALEWGLGWALVLAYSLLEDKVFSPPDLPSYVFPAAYLTADIFHLVQAEDEYQTTWTYKLAVASATATLLLLVLMLLTPVSPHFSLKPKSSSSGVSSSSRPPPSPWDTCSPLSRFLFLFTLPLMALSHSRSLQQGDIPEIPTTDWPLQRYRQFMRLWQEKWQAANEAEQNGGVRRRPSLARTLVSVFGGDFMLALPLWIGGAAGQQSIPWVLNYVLGVIEAGAAPGGGGPTATAALLVACALFTLTYTVQSLLYKRCWIVQVGVISQITFTLRGALFHKMLRLDPDACREHHVGYVTNLASTDISSLAFNLPSLCWALLDTAANLLLLPLFLYKLVGVSFLYALGVWILTLPLAAVLGSKVLQAIKEKMARADARVELSSEILDAMHLIKCLAWDQLFNHKVCERRSLELRAWRRVVLLNWLLSCLTASLPLLLGPLTLTLYFHALPRDEPASLATAFTALSFLWSLQAALQNVKNNYTQILTTQASFHRLEVFFDSSEKAPVKCLPQGSSGNLAVKIEGVSLGYPPSSTAATNDNNNSNGNNNVTINSNNNDSTVNSTNGNTNNNNSSCGGGGGGRDASKKAIMTAAAAASSSSSSSGSSSTSQQQPAAAAAPEGRSRIKSKRRLLFTEEEVTDKVVLRYLNVEITKGELVCVTGSVGSGKSTLLTAICGSSEVKLVDGTIAVASPPSDAPRFVPASNGLNSPNQHASSTDGVAIAGHSPAAAAAAAAPNVLPALDLFAVGLKSDGEFGRPILSYCPQEAWIFSGTVRDNILCGAEMNPGRYAAVLDACELNEDLSAIGPEGDRTLVGEQGVLLSGGQKARVALARAVYMPGVQIFCLDDVLNALDVHVSARVFQKCVLDLLANRTRILITRDSRFLSAADRTIEMTSNGSCVSTVRSAYELSGSEGMIPADLTNAESSLSPTQLTGESTPVRGSLNIPHLSPDLATIAQTEIQQASEQSQFLFAPQQDQASTTGRFYSRMFPLRSFFNRGASSQMNRNGDLTRPLLAQTDSELGADSTAKFSDSCDTNCRLSKAPSSCKLDPTEDTATNTKEITCGIFEEASRPFDAEKKKEGSVGLKVYLFFFQQVHWMMLVGMVMLACATVAADFVLKWWLTRWVEAQQPYGHDSSGTGDARYRYAFYSSVYLALAVASMLSDCMRDLYSRFIQYLIGRRLHEKVLASVLQAPMSFFQARPSGVVLSRLSADIATADLATTFLFATFLTDAVRLAFSLVFISSACLPTAAFLVPALAGYCAVQHFYVTPSRDLNRLVSLARAPTVSVYKEAGSGNSVLRAAGLEPRFERECLHRTLVGLRPLYSMFFVNETSAILMDALGLVALLAVTVFSGQAVFVGKLDVGIAALCITFSQEACGKMMWFVRQATSLEVNMVAIERLMELAELEHEPWEGEKEKKEEDTSLHSEERGGGGGRGEGTHHLVPESWPQSGTVEFDSLDVIYPGACSPALQGLSLKLDSGVHCGVVGRTGSGKSTLARSLFRTVLPHGGRVLVSGLDIKLPPLRRLRGALALVPQDPTLFQATVRENLDMRGLFSDSEIWSALTRAKADSLVRLRMSGLDGQVAARGDQLSVGEKQLLCIARSFLCQARVLVLDEASSSVDVETGTIIHQSLKSTLISGSIGHSSTPAFLTSVTNESLAVTKDKLPVDPTVLIIAHRLSSIQACDEIVVLKDGMLCEKASPTTLLENPDSLFARMMQANVL